MITRMTAGERLIGGAPASPDAGGAPVDAAVGARLRELPRGARLVLAVSGGRDSIALLAAVMRVAPERVAAVATFDHGTGPAARDAVRHVEREGARLGVSVVSGRGEHPDASEAEWRAARWRFLREVARAHDALVATAHTRDDNVETILMRAMRGAGARGLAALYAPSDVIRPLLDVARADVARYAEAAGLRWIDDPSNESLAYFRNRVRHEILPALLAVRPGLDEELLDIARRAAAVRRELARVVDALPVTREGSALVVAARGLADYDPESLRLLWSELASRVGVVLDARGTAGLARFTKEADAGDRMQLSGAVEVVRRRDAIVLGATLGENEQCAPRELPVSGTLEWGRWRFRVAEPADAGEARGSPWRATLPLDATLRVRAWRPGDRMHGAGDAAPRRVKRFLRDARVVGPERAGWPVVVAGERVMWIPGVRRSDAATVRSGRPEAVYLCERIERPEG
ncbi:MAG TPA: tRNA lysidine(34) synthetase TilS [Gemmatimonadaceae bacterium]